MAETLIRVNKRMILNIGKMRQGGIGKYKGKSNKSLHKAKNIVERHSNERNITCFVNME